MISAQELSKQIHIKNRRNAKAGLRHLVVLNGKVEWALGYLNAVESTNNALSGNENPDDTLDKSCLIYSDNPLVHSNVNAQNYRSKLGTQSDVVIYNDKLLHLDVLCALAGTLMSGGILFVIIEQGVNKAEGFLKRFFEHIDQSSFIWKVTQGDQKNRNVDSINKYSTETLDETIPENFHRSLISPSNNFPFQAKTQEQYQAILAILNVLKGHRNRPFVLTADRGRGKSSALAIACAELIHKESSPQKIVISASHRHSLTVFFEQLSHSLRHLSPDVSPEIKGNALTCGKSVVQFMPIDELIAQKVDARLILIDEAASIPVYLLLALANQYSRLVFSSTVHGYEGAGRGFGVIFKKSLKIISPEMQSLHIKKPIRWSNDDPLEKFISELCLLDAQLPALSQRSELKASFPVKNKNVSFERITSQALMNDEKLLNDVFAILITAHYQTSPNDLKLLLENPKVHTLILMHANQVIAVSLLLEEGDDLDCSILDIKTGKRRVKDQFLPQSLLSHLGVQNSFEYTYHRILRIAVHPELQNNGLGAYFIEKIQAYTKDLGVDFIGASFGLSSALLNFWLKSEFSINRIGFSKDKASGEYSVMMMKSLSSQSHTLQTRLTNDFYRQFTYLLSDEYAELQPAIVSKILSSCPTSSLSALSAFDLQAVKDFALSYRQYSCCVLGLHHWLQHHMVDLKLDDRVNNSDVYPLIMRVFQKRSVNDICKALDFTGKKALQNYLVEYVKRDYIEAII